MVEVKWSDGRGPAQRIQDRLRSSSPADAQRVQDHRTSQAGTENVPNRTITNVYFGGQQASSPNNQMPKGPDLLNQFGPDSNKRRP